MAKEGSPSAASWTASAPSPSMALQYGVPLEALVKKFAHQRFEPSGFTKTRTSATRSIIDYVFRWMAVQFIRVTARPPIPLNKNWPSGLDRRAKKKVNRPVPELPISDDTASLKPKRQCLQWPRPIRTYGNVASVTVSLVLAANQKDAPCAPTAATSPSATATATNALTAAKASGVRKLGRRRDHRRCFAQRKQTLLFDIGLDVTGRCDPRYVAMFEPQTEEKQSSGREARTSCRN